MTIQNYTLSYIENGKKQDVVCFSKRHLIKLYLELLESGRDISNLTIGMWTGVKKLVWTDITDKINNFLNI